MTDGTDLSVADVMALQNKDGDGFGGNGAWWIIILFLFLFGTGSGFGFGGRGEGLTQNELQRGFDFATVDRQLAGISNGICSLGYDQLREMNGLNTNIMQTGYGINNAITALGSQQAQCCCDTQKEILMSRANDDKNTCAIVNAIHADGEATRGLITENIIQQLRDQVQDGKIYASNCQQTNEILSSIGRYVTNPPCPPVYNCGCGCGGYTMA